MTPNSIKVKNVTADDLEKNKSEIEEALANYLSVPTHDVDIVGFKKSDKGLKPTDEGIFINFNQPCNATPEDEVGDLEKKIQENENLEKAQVEEAGMNLSLFSVHSK